MKNLINLVIASLLLLFSTSCQQKIDNEEKFRNWFLSAKAYNNVGKEKEALECLDSLNTAVKQKVSKKLSKEDIVKLTEIYSRGWIERGRIFRELGDYEGALKCFRRSINAYLGHEYDLENMFLSWDPILEADMERAETYEKMGEKEKAKKLRDYIEKYIEYNYSN